MHVAATQPLSLSTDDLDPAAVERERAILTETGAGVRQAARTWSRRWSRARSASSSEEVVLLKQAFVMNPDQTVEQLVADTGKELGSPGRR